MTIVDEPIEFEITDTDNAEGLRGDRELCPLAAALRRAFPNGDVRAGHRSVRVAGAIWLLPDGLREALHAFDEDGTPIPPGRYQLVERIFSR